MAFRSGFQILCQLPKNSLPANYSRNFSSGKGRKFVELRSENFPNQISEELLQVPKWFSSIQSYGSNPPRSESKISRGGSWRPTDKIIKLKMCGNEFTLKDIVPERVPHQMNLRHVQKTPGSAYVYTHYSPTILKTPIDAPKLPSIDPMPPFVTVEQRLLDLQERRLHPDYARHMYMKSPKERNHSLPYEEFRPPEEWDDAGYLHQSASRTPKTPKTCEEWRPLYSEYSSDQGAIFEKDVCANKKGYLNSIFAVPISKRTANGAQYVQKISPPVHKCSILPPKNSKLHSKYPFSMKGRCNKSNQVTVPAVNTKIRHYSDYSVRHFSNSTNKPDSAQSIFNMFKVPKSFNSLRQGVLDETSEMESSKLNNNYTGSKKTTKFAASVIRYYRHRCNEHAKMVKRSMVSSEGTTCLQNNPFSDLCTAPEPFRLSTKKEFHTSSVNSIQEIKPCAPPPPPKEPCGYLKKPEKPKKCGAIDAKDDKCKQKYKKNPSQRSKCGGCDKICVPPCKPPARDACYEVEESPPCRKILTPTPCYSECRCGPIPPHGKCPECYPKNMSCPQKPGPDLSCMTRKPNKVKLVCGRRPVPQQKPWSEDPECHKPIPCEKPYRADEHAPPKKWKPLRPIFPVEKKPYSTLVSSLRFYATKCTECKEIKPRTCKDQGPPIDPVIAAERYKTEGCVNCRKTVPPAKGSCSKWATKPYNKKKKDRREFSTTVDESISDNATTSRASAPSKQSVKVCNRKKQNKFPKLLCVPNGLKIFTPTRHICTRVQNGLMIFTPASHICTTVQNKIFTPTRHICSAVSKKIKFVVEQPPKPPLKNFAEKTIADLRLQTEGECIQNNCKKVRMPLQFCTPPARPNCVPGGVYFPCEKKLAPHPSYSECKEEDEPKNISECIDCPKSITKPKFYIKPGCVCSDEDTQNDTKSVCAKLQGSPRDINVSCRDCKFSTYSRHQPAYVANVLRKHIPIRYYSNYGRAHFYKKNNKLLCRETGKIVRKPQSSSHSINFTQILHNPELQEQNMKRVYSNDGRVNRNNNAQILCKNDDNLGTKTQHKACSTNLAQILHNPVMLEKYKEITESDSSRSFSSVDKDLMPGNKFLGPRKKICVPTARKVDPQQEEQCWLKKCKQLDDDPDYGTAECEKTPICDTPENRAKFCREQRKDTLGCSDEPNSSGRVCAKKPKPKSSQTPCFSTHAAHIPAVNCRSPLSKKVVSLPNAMLPPRKWFSSSSIRTQYKCDGDNDDKYKQQCEPPIPQPSLSKGIAKWVNKISNYFKARPNCPNPGEYEKEQLMIRAQEAAKAVGMELCPRKAVPGPKCCAFRQKPQKKLKKKLKPVCEKICMPGCAAPADRHQCVDEPLPLPKCIPLSAPYPSFSELRRFEFARKKECECTAVENSKWKKLYASADLKKYEQSTSLPMLPTPAGGCGTLDELLTGVAETCTACGGTGTKQITKKLGEASKNRLKYKKIKNLKRCRGFPCETLSTLDESLVSPQPPVYKTMKKKKIRASKGCRLKKGKKFSMPPGNTPMSCSSKMQECYRNFSKSSFSSTKQDSDVPKNKDGSKPNPPEKKKSKCTKMCCPGCPPIMERERCINPDLEYPPCKAQQVPYPSFTERKAFEYARKPISECSVVSDKEWDKLNNSMETMLAAREEKERERQREAKAQCGCSDDKSCDKCQKRTLHTGVARWFCDSQGGDKGGGGKGKKNPHELGEECKKAKFVPSNVELKHGEKKEICKPIEIKKPKPKQAKKCIPPRPKPKPKPRCGLPPGPPENLIDKEKRVVECCPVPPPVQYGPCENNKKRCFCTVCELEPMPLSEITNPLEPKAPPKVHVPVGYKYDDQKWFLDICTSIKDHSNVIPAEVNNEANTRIQISPVLTKKCNSHLYPPRKQSKTKFVDHKNNDNLKPKIISRTLEWGELNNKGQKIFKR